jgi:hypothetical protein
MHNEATILTVFKGPHGKSFSNNSISWYIPSNLQYKNTTEDKLCRSIKNPHTNLSQVCILIDAIMSFEGGSSRSHYVGESFWRRL